MRKKRWCTIINKARMVPSFPSACDVNDANDWRVVASDGAWLNNPRKGLLSWATQRKGRRSPSGPWLLGDDDKMWEQSCSSRVSSIPAWEKEQGVHDEQSSKSWQKEGKRSKHHRTSLQRGLNVARSDAWQSGSQQQFKSHWLALRSQSQAWNAAYTCEINRKKRLVWVR